MILNASLGVMGGVAELAVGVATSETGVGVYGIVDGSTRILFNAARLAGYLTKNNDFGNAMPGNLGGMVGKAIDGQGFYGSGRAQTILGIGNDITTMYFTGTNWDALPRTAIYSSGAERVTTLTAAVADAYTTGYYFNYTFFK